ncbi:MAG: helix-turn-helix transcriptional regulator [Bacteroidota bacterium]
MEASKTAVHNKLAANIRHLRKQLSLSQEDLANELGLNRGNIASYEKGTAEPKICNLLNLSHFYKVSVIDLTTSDLRCPVALGTARNNYQYELKEEDKEVLNKYYQQAEELKKVMESVEVCHQFRLKSMDNMPKELRCVVSNFDQLNSAGQMLLKAHNELLDFVKSRMK